MATTPRTVRGKFGSFEKALMAQRNELRMRIGNHRLDVVVEREPDDEAAQAYDNLSKDMAVATLERERRTLQEIESALARMKKGEYGTCASCEAIIPKPRLEAIPWARLCRECAENGGSLGGFRAVS